MSKLDSFFAPKSIVVVGASATKGKPGRTVIENLIANEFRGKIYPVNPRGGKICDLPVFNKIEDLPNRIEMAIVMLPANQTPKAMTVIMFLVLMNLLTVFINL